MVTGELRMAISDHRHWPQATRRVDCKLATRSFVNPELNSCLLLLWLLVVDWWLLLNGCWLLVGDADETLNRTL